jgi:hypothetical protein
MALSTQTPYTEPFLNKVHADLRFGDHFVLVPPVIDRYVSTLITNLPEKALLRVLQCLGKDDLVNFSCACQAHHVAANRFKSFCLAARFFSDPDVALYDKLVFSETYWTDNLGGLEIKPTIHMLYSLLADAIKASLLLKTENPGDPLHSEFSDELRNAFDKPDIRILFDNFPLTDSSLLEWFDSLGRAGMWSPIDFRGASTSEIPESLFEQLINTKPLGLLYRVREYLPVDQAGTSWFSDSFSDVLEFDKAIRSNGRPPLSNPLLLLDKKVAVDREKIKPVECKLPKTYLTRVNITRVPPTRAPTPSRTQTDRPTNMDLRALPQGTQRFQARRSRDCEIPF